MKNDRLTEADYTARSEDQNAGGVPGGNINQSVPVTTSGRGGGAAMAKDMATPLFPEKQGQDFRSRWDQIQIGFVDEPRQAVEKADQLIADTMNQLTTIFSDEREKMESRWEHGDDVSTEDLRVALQRYRSFFYRLLTI